MIDQKMSDRDVFKVLGSTPEKISELLNDVYKMTWEQILLLALYSRQQFIDQEINWSLPVESPINFSNKIKLVNILFHSREQKYELLGDKVLEKIENYEDIHSITSFLMSVISSDDKQNSELAKKLLNEISSNYISFTSKGSYSSKHPYSYYWMSRVLKYSIDIFRYLLDLNLSKEFINIKFLEALKYSIVGDRRIKGEYGIFESPIDNFLYEVKMSVDIESIIDLIIKNKEIRLEVDTLKKGIHHYFSKHMGDWINNLYFIIKNNSDSKDNILKNKNMFNNIINVDFKNDDLNNRVIRINEINLQNTISLGMIDNLLISLKNKLLDRNSTNQGLNENSLNEVVDWYRKSRSILFSDINDCPCLVTSILEFDFRNKVGVFDPVYGILIPIKKRTWFAKDGYLLVTGIIRRFLFKRDSIQNLYYTKDHSKYLNNINEYINNLYDNKYIDTIFNEKLEDIPNSENDLMKVWANLTFNSTLDENSKEYKALINRFKRLPRYLKEEKKEDIGLMSEKNKWNLYGFIWRQKFNSQKVGYPIDSPFPFPLWANFDSVDNSKIRILKIIKQVSDCRLTVKYF